MRTLDGGEQFTKHLKFIADLDSNACTYSLFSRMVGWGDKGSFYAVGKMGTLEKSA